METKKVASKSYPIISDGFALQQKMRSVALSEWLVLPDLSARLSGTLRKNASVGFRYQSQLLHEAICQTLGWGFEILPTSYVTFNDLPLSAFSWKENCTNENYSFSQLSGNRNWNGEKLQVFIMEGLPKHATIVICDQQFRNGTYLFSIDQIDGNEQMHLFKLNDGWFCLAANHKIQFGTEQFDQLPSFKKQSTIWKI